MLEFRNVTISRKKDIILNDFTMEIPSGAILALTGSDQNAKSAILEAASGFRKPDSGDILIDGLSLYLNKDECYQNTGYMSVETGLIRQLRVEEYYEMILSLYRIRGRNQRVRIGEVLEILGLPEYIDHFVEDIPPEQQHFLWLGKAILHSPAWLFLDQPFRGLDAAMREKMIRILIRLHDDGMTIVMNCSPMPELLNLITDVAAVEDGQILIAGSLGEVYEEVLRESPVKMKVLSNMDNALMVLRENPLVERVTVSGNEVIFRFGGEGKDEAELLKALVESDVLIQNYNRDRISMNEVFGM